MNFDRRVPDSWDLSGTMRRGCHDSDTMLANESEEFVTHWW